MTIIIEHPTRGTLREWDGEGEDRSFGFSWSGSRNDPAKAHQFGSVEHAREIFASMPERYRAYCQILRWSPSDGCYVVVSPFDPPVAGSVRDWSVTVEAFGHVLTTRARAESQEEAEALVLRRDVRFRCTSAEVRPL